MVDVLRGGSQWVGEGVRLPAGMPLLQLWCGDEEFICQLLAQRTLPPVTVANKQIHGGAE